MNDLPLPACDTACHPPPITNPAPPHRDDQEASRWMLEIAQTQERPARGTCAHFRYRVPSEDADELRAADPKPCPVCDAGRRRRTQVKWLG